MQGFKPAFIMILQLFHSDFKSELLTTLKEIDFTLGIFNIFVSVITVINYPFFRQMILIPLVLAQLLLMLQI